MKQHRYLKKAAVWLLMLVMALSMVGGCAGAGSRKNQPETTQQTTVRESNQDSKQKDDQSDNGKSQNPKQKDDKTDNGKSQNPKQEDEISEDGEYTSRDEVARYIYLYGHLPDNFITKNEAKKLGWESSKGNLRDVAPGKSIGGDTFGNREGYLPEKKGRKYYECDIGYEGGRRGAERLVYSNDGLVYYTGDHYNTFELLYGEE